MKELLAALFSLVLLTGCATTKRWGGLAAHDAGEAVRAPLHASSRSWMKAGALAGAVAASTLLDDRARDALQVESPRADDLAESVEPFGGRYADRVLAGFLIAGLAARDDRAVAVAFDGFVASMMASKVITPALKEVVHRKRPNGESDDSFPSNHATNAFAVASVIAAHYDQRWVDVAAYGLATAVGAARMRHDAHWLSDVAGGAVIGTSVGRFIARTNESSRAKWAVALSRREVVLSVRW